MAVIRAIDDRSVDQITSGQVVTSMASALKELVENALDSGATVVEVNIQNHGRDGFSVQDNGSGIAPEDFANVARRHATSKLASFSDLAAVRTLGFRGEALASLCALADVQITTNTGSGSGHELVFDSKGAVASQTKMARPKGTAVHVTNLFRTVPVRRRDFERNYQRELTKAVALLQEYALLSPVRLTVEHNVKNKRSMTLRSQGAKLLQRIACVYGASRTTKLLEIQLSPEDLGIDCTVSGYISKPVFGMGLATSDRQLIAVNGRPSKQPKLARTIVDVYKQFNLTESPFFVLDFEMDPARYDVNVSPDKRALLLHNEAQLVNGLRDALTIALNVAGHSVPRAHIETPSPKRQKQSRLSFAAFAGSGAVIAQSREEKDLDCSDEEEEEEEEDLDADEVHEVHEGTRQTSNSVLQVTPHESQKSPQAPEEAMPSPEAPPAPPAAMAEEAEFSSSSDSEHTELNNSAQGICRPASRSQLFSESSAAEEDVLPHTRPCDEHGCACDFEHDSGSDAQRACEHEAPPGQETGPLSELEPSSPSQNASSPIDRDGEFGTSEPIPDWAPSSPAVDAYIKAEIDGADESPSSLGAGSSGVHMRNGPSQSGDQSQRRSQPRALLAERMRPPSQPRSLNRHIHLPVSLADVARAKEEVGNGPQDMKSLRKLAIDEEGAEERLSLNIRKQDFSEMEVVGQFNLGFIVVVHRKKNHDDLFVIDQHASDEIFNFERLQRSTVLSRQPLVAPHPLELSAVEELTVAENLGVFENNGFSIQVSPANPPGRQCSLLSVPFSKNTVFDEKDVHDLLGKMQEDPDNKHVRCSKLRAMLAMRACRSSIMIGKALSLATMKQVVQNLGTLDKPWNCPHGRPTLRHITTLS